MTTAAAPSTPPPWRFFVAWALAGAVAVLGLLGLMTIGIVVLPVGVIALALLAVDRRARTGWAGALCGASLPFLYVGILNWGGPSTCTSSGVVRPGDGPVHCVEKWTPVPFLVVAVALVALGVGLQVAARRRARPPAAPELVPTTSTTATTATTADRPRPGSGSEPQRRSDR